jgi:hypothetical protein
MSVPPTSEKTIMTAEQLVAHVTATAPHLGLVQRILVVRFIAALATGGGAELARADRQRREHERQWEEEQLRGPALERRRREPA